MKPMRTTRLALFLAAAASTLALAPAALAQDDAALLDSYYELRDADPDAAYQLLLDGYPASSGDIRVPLELGFYQLQRENFAEALPFFEAASAIDPSRKEVQDQIGYINVALERDSAALAAFDRSLELQPSDEAIRLQRAYVLQRLGRNRAAAEAFYGLSGSSDQRIASQSCSSWQVLYNASDRAFDAPWFGESYFAPQYVSHFDLAVFPYQGRVGAVLDEETQLEAYGSLRVTADTRSGRGIFGPQNFYDNAAVIAAGLRVQPIEDVPVALFVEAGGAYDLTDLGRDRWRGDVRGGAVLYEEWGMAPPCLGESGGVRAVADVYAEAIYYSRYDDNVLFYARFRPGVRVWEDQDAAVDLYLLGATGFDTRGVAGNEYQELGAGAAAHIYGFGGLTLRAEGVRVFRHDGLDSYTTLRVGVEHAIRF